MALLSTLYGLLERLRLTRYSIGETVGRQAIFFALLSRVWRTLVLLILAIGVTLTLDMILVPRLFMWSQGTWVAGAAVHLETLLKSDAVTSLLVAIVAGMAALVAIMFSLSTLSYQMTARRFGDSISAFLMEEEVTSYVLGLALFSVLYSIWVLFLHRLIVAIPMFGVVVSVVLTTLAVVFLVTYRLHSFAMTQAKSISDRLRAVVAKQWKEVARPRRLVLGPSTENFLRLKASRALEQLDNISLSLLHQQQAHEPALVTLPAVLGLLYHYPRAKRHINPDSAWYPRVVAEVREQGPGYIDLKRIFQDLALGQPRLEQTKRDWLEEKVFRTLRQIRELAQDRGRQNTLYSLSFGYQELTIHAFESQETYIADRCMSELAELGRFGSQNDTSLSSAIVEVLVNIGDRAARGFSVEDALGVALKANWNKPADYEDRGLPSEFEQIAQLWHERIRNEITIEGRRVTPLPWVKEWLKVELTQRADEICVQLFSNCQEILNSVHRVAKENNQSERALATAYGMLMLLRRATVHKKPSLAETHLSSLAKILSTTYENAPKTAELIGPYVEEVALFTLISVHSRHESNYQTLLPHAVYLLSRELSDVADEKRLTTAAEFLVVIGGLAFVTSEFYQEPLWY